MIDQDDVIRHSCDENQWADFEQHIEMLGPEDLDTLNAQLNAGVPDNSNWHDYADAFCRYSWREFTLAYEATTDQPY